MDSPAQQVVGGFPSRIIRIISAGPTQARHASLPSALEWATRGTARQHRRRGGVVSSPAHPRHAHAHTRTHAHTHAWTRALPTTLPLPSPRRTGMRARGGQCGRCPWLRAQGPRRRREIVPPPPRHPAPQYGRAGLPPPPNPGFPAPTSLERSRPLTLVGAASPARRAGREVRRQAPGCLSRRVRPNRSAPVTQQPPQPEPRTRRGRGRQGAGPRAGLSRPRAASEGRAGDPAAAGIHPRR